jgi:hypothetical protein
VSRTEPENLGSACRALVSFGVPIEIVDALRSSGPDDIVWLGRAPTRIDLLRSLPGVDFAAAWAKRVTLEIGGRRRTPSPSRGATASASDFRARNDACDPATGLSRRDDVSLA